MKWFRTKTSGRIFTRYSQVSIGKGPSRARSEREGLVRSCLPVRCVSRQTWVRPLPPCSASPNNRQDTRTLFATLEVQRLRHCKDELRNLCQDNQPTFCSLYHPRSALPLHRSARVAHGRSILQGRFSL